MQRFVDQFARYYTPAVIVEAITVADRLRPQAREAAAALREVGIARVVMLTSDHPDRASAISGAAGVDECRAGLLPEDKVAIIRDLRARYGAVVIDLSRRATATFHWNVAFVRLLKAAFLGLTVPGLVTLWWAILSDTGAALLVTLTGMRLLRYRPASSAGSSSDSA